MLSAYLGARTGPKVLAGQIRRGTGVELTAVLWSMRRRSRSAITDLDHSIARQPVRALGEGKDGEGRRGKAFPMRIRAMIGPRRAPASALTLVAAAFFAAPSR